MKKKIIALGFCAMILGLGFHAGAQQAKKIPRMIRPRSVLPRKRLA